MINYLKDIKKETLIGQLPDVINSNNESIRKEFNWIFDSSLNRLTKSVYAPTGSVKSHFGEFTNLACEYFTIKNTDSIKASIQDSVESIINETLNVSSMQTVMAALTNIANSSFIDPSAYDISALCDISTLIINHNVLNNRFKDADFIDDNQQDFCHDAAAIIYKKDKNNRYITVEQALNAVVISDTSIDELIDEIQNCNTSLNNVIAEVENCNASIGNIKQVNQQQNVLIQNLNVSTQQQDASIKRLFAQNNILNTSVNLLNTSINNLDNQITAIAKDVKKLNINNIIQNGNEILLYKNQNNILFEPIYDNNGINVVFSKEPEHEYNFKFILGENINSIQLTINGWFNISKGDKLFINNDNIKIGYDTYYDVFELTREGNAENIIMCDITINKYFNNESYGICTMSCKTFSYLKPE